MAATYRVIRCMAHRIYTSLQYAYTHCCVVQEADEPWSWDILFTDVSSELTAEWFPETEEEKKEAVKERPYTAFNRFPV